MIKGRALAVVDLPGAPY